MTILRVGVLLGIAVVGILLGGCRTPSSGQKGRSTQGITGTWSTFTSGHGFGSSVLIADFEKTGRYTLTWAGPLPATPQPDGSQPLQGLYEEGRYHIDGNTLYLEPQGGDTTARWKCTITFPRQDTLILNTDGVHAYNFMRCQPRKSSPGQ